MPFSNLDLRFEIGHIPFQALNVGNHANRLGRCTSIDALLFQFTASFRYFRVEIGHFVAKLGGKFGQNLETGNMTKFEKSTSLCHNFKYKIGINRMKICVEHTFKTKK